MIRAGNYIRGIILNRLKWWRRTPPNKVRPSHTQATNEAELGLKPDVIPSRNGVEARNLRFLGIIPPEKKA